MILLISESVFVFFVFFFFSHNLANYIVHIEYIYNQVCTQLILFLAECVMCRDVQLPLKHTIIYLEIF